MVLVWQVGRILVARLVRVGVRIVMDQGMDDGRWMMMLVSLVLVAYGPRLPG